MHSNIIVHHEYNGAHERGTIPLNLHQALEERRARLKAKTLAHGLPAVDTERMEWEARSYPALSILAPVMSTNEGKIEFPGDPMCLYTALSYAVHQARQARRAGPGAGQPYNDLCPQWGEFPSAEYRATADANGIRKYDGPLNTDQTIFDPRVWNEKVREYFIHKVLLIVRPKVVLISAVSPAHRYAIDIARTIRATLPDCLIVLGGRHTDETLHFNPVTQHLVIEPSSSLARMFEDSIEPVFDFLIAGDGYYALDLLMKIISLSMDIATRTTTVERVIENLSALASFFDPMPGRAVIVAVGPQATHAWPLISGIRLDLAVLPSPYAAFAIRAFFPIFQREGRVLRTAHFMVTNACTFHCYFCSEGSTVVGRFISFHSDEIQQAVKRVVEYVSYGAEAIFFDDSVFWGGNFGAIITFSRELTRLRELATKAPTRTLQLFEYEVDAQKLANLQWGAQFTVDLLASRRQPEEAILALHEMNKAGCVYVYMGIESMSTPVIVNVHKNINRTKPWEERIRTALGMARQAGITVGSSVLFGLDGETRETMEETISKVEELLAEDLLSIASPNILTYHPNTEITAKHGMKDKIDYHSLDLENRPPYVYFEEAFPAVVSKNLTEEQVWFIHEQTRERWGTKRNTNPMPEVFLPQT